MGQACCIDNKYHCYFPFSPRFISYIFHNIISVGRTAYGLTAVRSAMVEWSINLGEMVMQIEEGKFISVGGSGGDKASDR
jgi:hypothetical protein